LIEVVHKVDDLNFFYVLFMKILFLLIPFFVLSQSIKVDYTYTTDEYVNQETLIANQNSSYYYNKSFLGENKKKDKINGNEANLVQKNIKLNKIEYFQNKNNPILHFQLKYKGVNRLIIDSLPEINWNIDNKAIKKINGYTCNKAITKFRGREYEAWFTTQIPINFGPFKFNGLPGLIISINSIGGNSFNSWIATRINTKFDEKTDSKLYDDCITMSMREYIEFGQNLREKASKASVARLPKGYNNVKTTYERLSVERVFEWETEDEEK
jgi:GLPGLI family protein